MSDVSCLFMQSTDRWYGGVLEAAGHKDLGPSRLAFTARWDIVDYLNILSKPSSQYLTL